MAVKLIKKKLKKDTTFKPSSIKRILTKIFDFYLYEYWRETTKKDNAYSAQRVDSVRRMLQGVFEVYG